MGGRKKYLNCGSDAKNSTLQLSLWCWRVPGYLLDDWFLVDRTLSRMEGMKMGEGVTWDALSFLCLFWEKKEPYKTYTFVKIDMTKTF